MTGMRQWGLRGVIPAVGPVLGQCEPGPYQAQGTPQRNREPGGREYGSSPGAGYSSYDTYWPSQNHLCGHLVSCMVTLGELCVAESPKPYLLMFVGVTVP